MINFKNNSATDDRAAAPKGSRRRGGGAVEATAEIPPPNVDDVGPAEQIVPAGATVHGPAASAAGDAPTPRVHPGAKRRLAKAKLKSPKECGRADGSVPTEAVCDAPGDPTRPDVAGSVEPPGGAETEQIVHADLPVPVARTSDDGASTTTVLVERLTEQDQQDFNRYDHIVRKFLPSFVEFGAALREIRDRRLYRGEGFTSMDDYCASRLKLTARRAFQLVTASRVSGTLPSSLQPKNEGHARELATVPPEKRAEVLEAARAKSERDGVKLTAALIREVKIGLGLGRPKSPTQGSDNGSGPSKRGQAAGGPGSPGRPRREDVRVRKIDAEPGQLDSLWAVVDDPEGAEALVLEHPDGPGRSAYVVFAEHATAFARWILHERDGALASEGGNGR